MKPELEGIGKSEMDASSVVDHKEELSATSTRAEELEVASQCFEMDARSTRTARELEAPSVRVPDLEFSRHDE